MTVARPTFSIVMAAHNTVSTIGEAIESVRRQTRSDWELIVIDDGSEDGTADRAEAFADPRVRVVREAGNRGPAAARNRGIALAEASLVCTLDSDDLWLPSYLETMAMTLESEPDTAVACTEAWVLDGATLRVRRTSAMAYQHPPQPLPTDRRVFFLQLLQRNFIYNSVTARREALLSVGGYDERLWVGEDWELWLRLAAAGFRFVRVPQRLAVYRARARSLTSDSARLLAGRQEVYRVVAEDWPDRGEFRDLALNLRRARASRVRRRALGRRVLKPLLTAWRVVRDANLWYQEAPREVADLLMAVATPPEG